ncbi:transcriptional regulator [Candidatus Marinamargulisbacteria bacterium SCGC AAA071-K20]|nr:transcriptional regulator [Candidatus Marinamargulisbacteria bacterium SCGC AAA071-K20]
MTLSKQKIITIVTETRLESALCEDIEKLGGHGYTITDARGKGHRGVRDAVWAANANIRIEVVCEPEVAKNITEHLKKHYFDNYAMILFTGDVQVLRPDKF